MNAKDLRIGNCVLLDTGLTLPDFHIIRANDIQVIDDKILKDISIEPILLTEEILLKFGFEKIGDNLYEKDGIQLEFGWYEQITVHVNSVFVVNINYFHQLQNLVYALTGEEL